MSKLLLGRSCEAELAGVSAGALAVSVLGSVGVVSTGVSGVTLAS